MTSNTGIAWTDLTVGVKPFLAKTHKIILNQISGNFEFNTINALLGSSGSGKTTLLRVLNASNKYCFSEESGIWVPSGLKINKCFIYQNHDQRVMTGLTVRQALTYASKLKNSSETGVNHKEIVTQVMSNLLIGDIENNLIVICSGGEIKRFCIALELTAVHKPNVLFLDEPTTGLDSNAAEVFIECLRGLSRSHRMSIITSIHQPNNDLFLMFDSVYVLAKGGVCLYSGPPQSLRRHLNECQTECTANQIPIEVIIKLSSNGINDKTVRQLADKTREHPKSFDTTDMTKTERGLKNERKDFKLIDFWYLLIRFLYRNYVSNWKSFLKSMTLFSLLIIFITKCYNEKITVIDGCFQTNLTCLQIDEENLYLYESKSLISYSTFFTMVIIAVYQTHAFIRDFVTFRSEYHNMWYSALPYISAKFIAESVLIIIYSMLFVLIVQVIRPLVEVNYKLALFWYIILMSFWIMQCIASIIGTLLSHNINLAILIALITSVTLTTYNNFMFHISELPRALQIISEFDYYKYIFNSLLILVYGFGRCSDGRQSTVLIEFELEEDEEYQFWRYIYLFFIYFSVLLITEFTIFWVKMNGINIFGFNSRIKSMESIEESNENPIETNVESEDKYLDINDRIFGGIQTNLSIAWIDLTHGIKRRNLFNNENVVILDGISGSFNDCSLNAIMGPSGAGKTTLLRSLNEKKFRNLSKDTKIFISSGRFNTCFIEQNIFDHLLVGLTVRQTLLYASKLKNSRIVKELDHNQIASDLMSELLISDTADNRVESCSGGEQKRVVIGAELTACVKPRIIFIDEPTSGLDSNAAQVVIACLRRLSRTHRMTVIATIHQPNQDLFLMFDKLYVLAKGGVSVYSGPPQDLRQHLNACNIEFTENQIPIEVLLKISSEDRKSESINFLRLRTSAQNNDLNEKCLTQRMRLMSGQTNTTKRLSFRDFYHLLLRTMTYTYVCQWRTLLIIYLNPILFGLSLKLNYNRDMVIPDGCIGNGLNSGCNQTTEKLYDNYLINSNIIHNAMLIITIFFTIMVVTALTFRTDYRIFRNEHSNGRYSTCAYMWAKTLTDFLGQVILILLYVWCTNLYSSSKIVLANIAINMAYMVCAQSLGQICAIIYSNDGKMSLLLSFLLCEMFFILGNQMTPLKELHYSLRLLSSLSFMRWGFGALLIAIYGFDRCSEDQISSVLRAFDIERTGFWFYLFNLFMISVLLKILSVLFLMSKSFIFSTSEPRKPKDSLNVLDNSREKSSIIF